MSRDFRSDNVAPPAAPMTRAALAACENWSDAYAEDRLTAGLEATLANLFGREVAAFPILTGTAANALALAQLCGRFSQVMCHRSAHIHLDECGAVEFHNPGCRIVPLDGADGKLGIEACARALGAADDVHRLRSSALSLSQASEAGTVYRTGEIEALAGWARAMGLSVHMDGTRFANALAASGATPAEMTWRAGVDVLCLGATKGGAIGAEVVVFFDRGQAGDFRRLMKRSGHLASRMWFMAAQLEAYLADGFWLEAARHANAMAARLAAALADGGRTAPCYPVETNMVFLSLGETERLRLRENGFDFYMVDDGSGGPMARLVTSHATRAEDVDALADALRAGA